MSSTQDDLHMIHQYKDAQTSPLQSAEDALCLLYIEHGVVVALCFDESHEACSVEISESCSNEKDDNQIFGIY